MKKLLLLVGLTLLSTGAFAASSAFEDAIQKARTAFEAKNYPTARTSLGTALGVAKTPDEKVRVLLNIADTYNDEKNYVKARESWQQVVDTKGAATKDRLGALGGIAGSFVEEKRFAEARATLSKIVSDPLAPAELKATSRMGIAEIYGEEGQSAPARQGQLEVARREYAKIGADAGVPLPLRFFSQMRAGDIGMSQSKWAQARADYDKAAHLPGLDTLSMASAVGHVVETFYSEGNPAQAEAVQIPAVNQLIEEGTKSFNDDKFAEARSYYSAVLLVGGNHADPLQTVTVHRQVAETYLGEHNLEQAGKELDEVSKLIAQAKKQDKGTDPERARAIQLAEQTTAASIASLHSKQGQKLLARQEYQKILQMPYLDPTIRKGVEEFLKKTGA